MSYDRRKPLDVESLVSVKVDNLSYRTNADQLKRAFDKFGEIGDVYIPRDPYGHEASRGFGFVRFYDSRDADDAVHAMDGIMLNGREIRVQLARHSRSHRSDFTSSRSRRHQRRSRSRSRTRSRSRHRRRRSRSSSRDNRRRTRSRSRDRSRRSRSRNSRKRELSRSRSRSAKRHRPEENGSRSPQESNRNLKNDETMKDVDFQNNVTPQIDIPACHGNDSNVEMESEQIHDQNTSALKEVDVEVAVVDAVEIRDDEYDDNLANAVEEAEPAMNIEEKEEFEEQKNSEDGGEMIEKIVDEDNDDHLPTEAGDEVRAQETEDTGNDNSETLPCEENEGNNDEGKHDDQPEGTAENSLHDDNGDVDYDENNES